jgi:hypothetical protein
MKTFCLAAYHIYPWKNLSSNIVCMFLTLLSDCRGLLNVDLDCCPIAWRPKASNHDLNWPHPVDVRCVIECYGFVGSFFNRPDWCGPIAPLRKSWRTVELRVHDTKDSLWRGTRSGLVDGAECHWHFRNYTPRTSLQPLGNLKCQCKLWRCAWGGESVP